MRVGVKVNGMGSSGSHLVVVKVQQRAETTAVQLHIADLRVVVLSAHLAALFETLHMQAEGIGGASGGEG